MATRLADWVRFDCANPKAIVVTVDLGGAAGGELLDSKFLPLGNTGWTFKAAFKVRCDNETGLLQLGENGSVVYAGNNLSITIGDVPTTLEMKFDITVIGSPSRTEHSTVLCSTRGWFKFPHSNSELNVSVFRRNCGPTAIPDENKTASGGERIEALPTHVQLPAGSVAVGPFVADVTEDVVRLTLDLSSAKEKHCYKTPEGGHAAVGTTPFSVKARVFVHLRYGCAFLDGSKGSLGTNLSFRFAHGQLTLTFDPKVTGVRSSSGNYDVVATTDGKWATAEGSASGIMFEAIRFAPSLINAARRQRSSVGDASLSETASTQETQAAFIGVSCECGRAKRQRDAGEAST